MRRQERQHDDIDIEDEQTVLLKRLIEGRTVIRFEREPGSGVDWQHGENSVSITFDDGSVLSFYGYGYDASGLRTTYSPTSGNEGRSDG